jgi:Flp pilus assembly protein TadG
MSRFTHKLSGTRQRGQSTVEFALAALLLLMMLFGIMEVSRQVLTVSGLSHAARESAHYAALHPESTVVTLTQRMAGQLIFVAPADVRVTLDCPTCSGAGVCLPPTCYTAIHQPLTVTLGYTLTTVVPLPGFTRGIPIIERATARREQ